MMNKGTHIILFWIPLLVNGDRREILRTNYGVLFQNAYTIDNSASYWDQTFAVSLPTFPQTVKQDFPCTGKSKDITEPHAELCEMFGPMFRRYREKSMQL